MNNHDMYAATIVGRQPEFIFNQNSKVKTMETACRCKICGCQIEEGAPAKILDTSFTNIAQVACKESAWLCRYCESLTISANVKMAQGYLPYPSKPGKDASPAEVEDYEKEFADIQAENKKMFGIIFMGGDHPSSRKVMKSEAVECMLNPPTNGKPFIFVKRVPGYVANSMSRHTAWMARVNLNTKRYFIQVTTDSLYVDTDELKDVLEILKTMEKPTWPISGDFGISPLLRGIIANDRDKQIPTLEQLGRYPQDIIKIAAFALEAQQENDKNQGEKK